MTDHPAPGHPAAPAGASDVTAAAEAAPETNGASAAGAGDLYDAEVLVEEVSIDGMCGVY